MAANNIQEFSLSLDAYAKRLGLHMEVVVRNVVGRIFENVIRLTPVDTGWARNNWYVTLNARGAQAGAPNPFTGKTQAPLPGADPFPGVAPGRLGDIFWLDNGVPYIGALEHGHSGQAPHGMVAVAVASAKAFIEQYAKSGSYQSAQAAAMGIAGAK